MEVAQKIENPKEVSILVDSASAMAEAGDGKRALELAHEIEDASQKASAIKGIAWAMARTGNSKQAVEVVKNLGESGRTSVLRGISLHLAAARDGKQAAEVSHEIDNTRDKAFVLISVASTLTKVEENEQALATLKQAVDVTERIEDAGTKEVLLRNIAMKLAIEPVPVNNKVTVLYRPYGMKRAFTLKEKQLGKQIVEALRDN